MDSDRKPLNIQRNHWDLASAAVFIRNIQEQAHACGYNLLLGGGVLNNGFSANDLDIVAMPRSLQRRPDETSLLELFRVDKSWAADPPTIVLNPRRNIHRVYPKSSADNRHAIDLIIVLP